MRRKSHLIFAQQSVQSLMHHKRLTHPLELGCECHKYSLHASKSSSLCATVCRIASARFHVTRSSIVIFQLACKKRYFFTEVREVPLFARSCVKLPEKSEIKMQQWHSGVIFVRVNTVSAINVSKVVFVNENAE